MERSIDPRLIAFKEYVDEQIAAQERRPYSERQDIERVVGIYNAARQVYDQLVSTQVDPEVVRKLGLNVSELELSVRTSNSLEMMRIATIGQLTERSYSELSKIRGLGKIGLGEITRRLEDMGLSLRGQ